VLAVTFTLSTYFFAAVTYRMLAFKYIGLPRTVLMQFACMLVNRLLPGGVGGLGANYAYLRKSQHTASQAVSVVAMNNILGAVGHITVLLGALVLASGRVGRFHMTLPSIHLWVVTLVACPAVIGVVWLAHSKFRQLAVKTVHDLGKQLATYRRRPLRVLVAWGSSIGLTLGNVATLMCTVAAVHIHVSFVTVLIIFTVGVTVGTVTPTPGGLGGVEAGLVAGIVAYGNPADRALAAVLLFRLVNYWLPLLLGVFAFAHAQRRQYF